MNNSDFEQNFINALQKLGIQDYENKRIVIESVYEKEKWTYKTYDEIMRLQFLPKTRKMSFHEAVSLFTFWEGYYPCWIKISVLHDEIYLKTSLRMRKVNRNHTLSETHPFQAD